MPKLQLFPGKRPLLTLLLFSSFSFALSAQKNLQQRIALEQKILADKKVTAVLISDERETPSSIFFDFAKPSYQEAETPALLRNFLSLRAGYDVYAKVRQTIMNAALHVAEFRQYFKGVPVAYSSYKSLIRNSDILVLAGSYYQIPASLSVTPALSETDALDIAKKQVGAKKYAWEEVQDRIVAAKDENVKKLLQAELKEFLPKGELVIIKDFTNELQADMRLAYKFNLYAAEPLSRGFIYIDAQTGKVLLYDAIIKHASDPTTVRTRYAGDRVILTTVISGNDPGNGQVLMSSHPQTEPSYVPGSPTHVLRDLNRGRTPLETFDLNGAGGLPLSIGALYAQAKSFTDQDNNWTLAEHKRGGAEGGPNEAENDDIAWDAHWGAETVYDYWGKRHNRKSYDDKNAGIKSYIHYGSSYDNAFWNGTAMTYGDGSGQQARGFKPLTSLDVCGHEIGHGVCSNTSDLVYANESGALNEGFSDIWAACVENYVIKEVDPTLKATYKPFFIGEQISYGTDPLRRMDNPKSVGDPDTRFGKNYRNPNCTPTLANDQCGVHTNSNVLNKWFYLLTCGSGAGSGPDVSYVIPGADDGKRDDTTGGLKQDVVPYSVTGLGFAVSEKLAYLTELMLSSTATYDEARAMSIAAAKAVSGDPCGQIVESVTNAWFAVGVGPAFTAPCIVTHGFLTQPGITTSEGTKGVGCTGTDTIYLPILLPANSSATVSTSGTATANVDYTIPKVAFTNSTNRVKVDTIQVNVINDAVVEPEETIKLTLAFINLGNNASNNTFTVTIEDNDVTPVIGTDSVTLLTENFESVNRGFNLPAGWVETLEVPETPGSDPSTNGKNHWGVFQPGMPNNTKTLAVTGSVPATFLGLGSITPPDGYYINTSPSQTRASTPIIDARGLRNLRLSFNFTVQGEVDPNGADFEAFGKFDYMELVYSYDGATYRPIGDGFAFASAQPFTGRFDTILPNFLNNRRFYLAFRWYNDTNAGGPFSISVDNVVIKGEPRRIETIAGRTSNETINGAQEVYFYSNPDGNIISKVNSTGANNYGCVTATVEKAGTSAFTLYPANNEDNKVGDKFIRIAPTTNDPNGTYAISLYFTNEEIRAIENATATAKDHFYIYKTSAAAFQDATAANTVRKAASFVPVAGGGIFTATFTTGFSGFAVGAPVASALPITCTEFKATRIENSVHLNWKVANEESNHRYEIERSTDGVNFKSIATLNRGSNSSGLYSYNDNSTNGLTVYYRLKETSADGTFHYICDIQQLKQSGKVLVIGKAYPNPAKAMVMVKIAASESQRLHIELVNHLGQVFNSYIQQINQGESSVPITLHNAAAGTYMLRFKDSDGKMLSAQTVVVQR